jgi:hypothetical protein
MEGGMKPEGCLSNYALDRLAAGELPDAAAAEWHLGGCARCSARRAELGRGRDGFRAAPPPLRRAKAAATGWWVSGVAAATTVALAAAAILLLLPDTTRTKGGPRVEAFVRHDGAVRVAGPGERVAPGDGVQLAVSTAEPRHVGVVGVDAARAVTIYREATPVPAGESLPLDFSVAFDDVLGTERIWVLVCDGAAPLATFAGALRVSPASEPPPPPGCAATRLVFYKER